MPALSINLQVADRQVVLVGAGRVAARKAAALLQAGAIVRIIAPRFNAALRNLQDRHLEFVERVYEEGDLAGALLVIAATDDADLNAKVCADARALAVLCSNAGDAATGDFSMPATSHHGELTVTVDTGGASPALAKRLLEQIETQLDPHAEAAARNLARMRAYIRPLANMFERTNVLREIATRPLALLASMTAGQAQRAIDETLRRQRETIGATAPGPAVCASRGSRLALAQTTSVISRLEEAGIRSQVVTIATHGDLRPHDPLSSMQVENIFVKEIETALLAGRADYAVHSCKDLPSTLQAGLQLIAISHREDPCDAYCSERFASFDALPAGARVGTSSVRRRSQLRALRPDLDYCDVRGNVDTRLRKLRAGEFDALVLAMAGLIRLNARAAFTVPFEASEIVPAVGQGALAVEMREGAGPLAATIRAAINDERSEIAILCERAALAALGGGCNAPIGICAHWQGDVLNVNGIVLSADGTRVVRARVKGAADTPARAVNLGDRLAVQLHASGAAQILGLQRT